MDVVFVLFAIIAVLNFYSFFIYYYDKRCSVRNKRRISEKNLLISAFCFGAAGAYIAMRKFRHKTKHRKFTILVPLFLMFQVILVCAAIYFLK
ncbi:MAG: DUF1294 domain-containing protein [Clostridia bacterium]|nr:DUF1294 domain-containing protein [Clostridia bacterium]